MFWFSGDFTVFSKETPVCTVCSLVLSVIGGMLRDSVTSYRSRITWVKGGIRVKVNLLAANGVLKGWSNSPIWCLRLYGNIWHIVRQEFYFRWYCAIEGSNYRYQWWVLVKAEAVNFNRTESGAQVGWSYWAVLLTVISESNIIKA